MKRFIRGIQEALGLFEIDDSLPREIARAIYAACSVLPVHKYHRQQAQEILAMAAREAILDVFVKYYPEREGSLRIGRSWPRASCMIKGNTALIEPWIGIDYHDQGEGIEPISVPINRHPKAEAKLSAGRVEESAHRATQPGVTQARPSTPPATPPTTQKPVAKQPALTAKAAPIKPQGQKR